MSRRNGFTIVELTVVIIVIAILVTIVSLGLTRYQAAGRDALRASNATAIAEALEKYYGENGEYPSCPAITATAPTVSSVTLKGIDQSILLTPTPVSNTDNSIQCNDITANSDEDYFAYVADSTDECQEGSACAYWTLKYLHEEENSVDAIESRHRADIVTVAAPTGLSVTATLTGSLARGTSGGGVCPSGATIERQMRYRSTSTSSTGTWSAWVSTLQIDTPSSEGYMYSFEQRARCKQSVTYSAWASSGIQSVTRQITTIPAITVSASTSGTTTTFTHSTPTCPAGTIARYQYRYLADWGYTSTWYGPSTAASWSWGTSSQGYQYQIEAQAHCYTYRSTGAWGSTAGASYIRPVDPPSSTATNWTFSVAGDRKSYRYDWTMPTCGPGALPESHYNSYIGGSGQLIWTATGTNGWLYGAGNWGTQNYWSAGYSVTMTTGTVASGVPVNHRVQYICMNQTTGRNSGWGTATNSPTFNT